MITNSANKVIVAGNGAQTVFAFGFVGAAADDIYAIYTDASGNETALVQGPGPTQFQVTLNAATSGSLWGVGGSVTYNPSGTPIANGTTLTIYRDVAFTQDVSLQNQSSYGQYAQAAETAMDLLEMQIQQLAEEQSRALSAPIVDPAGLNLTLPAAAQRANTGLAFDGDGNVIAGVVPATGLISSAMQPVCDAASISAALALLGIGTIATLSPNYGLQESVSAANELDVNFATAQDAANQTVTKAFHLTQRFATGALSYTLPRANTLWNGFGFWVTALTAPITFAVNSNDNFPGLAGGASYIIPVGTSAYITTNGAATGTWFARGVQRLGLNSPLNLQISASVSGNVLTVNVLDSNGNAPSTTSPILAAFRDPTAANGDPVIRAITSALSISTPATGATFGVPNTQPFKLWLGWFDNAGTPVLGLFQSASFAALAQPTGVAPINETAPTSGTLIGTGSTSPGTWYTAAAVANVSFRVLGYLEFSGGQATAGVWASAQSKTQLMGPGINLPGSASNFQFAVNSSGASFGGSSVPLKVGPIVSITPTSAAHIIRVHAEGCGNVTSASALAIWTGGLSHSGSYSKLPNSPLWGYGYGDNADALFVWSTTGYDAPNSTSAQSYSFWGASNNAQSASQDGAATAEAWEIAT